MAKEKPQTIKITVESVFSNIYTVQLGKAIRGKFHIDCGIEGDFTGCDGMSELLIRFLATDEKAESVLDYITRIWEFMSEPQLLS